MASAIPPSHNPHVSGAPHILPVAGVGPQEDLCNRLLEDYVSKHSTPHRKIQINSLPEEKRLLALEVQQTLDNLATYFRQYTTPLDTAPIVEEEREELAEFIRAQLQSFCSQYSPCGLNEDFLSGIEPYATSYLEFIFAKEVTLNRFINNLLYTGEVERFLEQHKEELIREFVGGNALQQLDKVEFILEIKEQETHHQGKSPVIVKIFIDKKECQKIVFKPRDALVDKEIIKVFDEINQLAATKENSETDATDRLPVYKIKSFPGQSASLWEFINGQHPAQMFVGTQIGSLTPSHQKEILLKRLQRMDAILTRMQCSDLHRENVFLIGFTKKFELNHKEIPAIVPIDLENIQG